MSRPTRNLGCGGAGFVAGTLAGVLVLGLIQTCITLDGTSSGWWIGIAIGALLFGIIVLQRRLLSFKQRGSSQGTH